MAKNAKFGPPKMFFKNLASSVTRYHGQLSKRTISGKTNDPILRKLIDGRTDRRTDGRTGAREYVELMLSVQKKFGCT